MSRQFSGFQTKKNCTAGRTGAISLVSMERALNVRSLGFSVIGSFQSRGKENGVNMRKQFNTNMAAVLLSWETNMGRNLERMLREKIFAVI